MFRRKTEIVIPEIAMDLRTVSQKNAAAIDRQLEKLRGDKAAEQNERDRLKLLIEDCDERERDLDLSIAAFELAAGKLGEVAIDAGGELMAPTIADAFAHYTEDKVDG